MAATPTTSTEFLDLLSKSGLLSEEQLAEMDDLPEEPTSCAAVLIAKGAITKFQAKLLLNGRYKGFKLGPYIIREQIGQGGMGAVYSAEHETLKRRVALKVLSVPKDGNATLSIERFLREARSAAALDHPNIVRLHDVGKAAETHYIVMEYVEGQTLDQIITRSGSISSSRAVEYIAQAAAGLQHAFEKGFVHRDIKPGNLMLAKDGTVKILDFGLARATDTTESDKLTEIMDKGAIVGTADFISPEQAMNAPLDIRSDIYSLGASFFALVTGQPPFSGNTTQKLIQHQMKEAPSVITLDRTFPPGLSKIVAKMLSKKPEHRFQTPAEVIQALAEWIPQQATGKMSAAISGTDMANSAEMQTTLSEIASGTKRLGSNPRLNPDEEEEVPARSQLFWASIAGGILLAAVGITAVILGLRTDETPKNNIPAAVTDVNPVLGPTPTVTPVVSPTSTVELIPKKAPEKKAAPKAEPKSSPKAGPKAAPKVEPKPVVVETTPVNTALNPTGPLLYRLDLSDQKSFTDKGRVLNRTTSGSGQWTSEMKIGDGSLPTGWAGYCFNNACVAEFASQIVDGQSALGFRVVSGPHAAMLTTPSFECPSGKAFLTFEYKMKPDGLGVRFLRRKPSTKAAFDIANPVGNNQWKTFRQEIDLNGGTFGNFELHYRGAQGNDFLWIRNFTVHQAGAPGERASRDIVLHEVDFQKMKPATERIELMSTTTTRRAIDGQTLPANLTINHHRPNISGEYSIAEVNGAMALGFRLIEGDTGVQIQSTCGEAFNHLEPGESAVVKITYSFDGEGFGSTAVQHTKTPWPKYSLHDLAPTQGQWKTIQYTFTRPPEKDQDKFDLIINAGNKTTTKPRAEGTIWVKSIEVWPSAGDVPSK
ncbi:hypothetical protein BH11PLA2_BH11PLA2_04280 [soil metagenome]